MKLNEIKELETLLYNRDTQLGEVTKRIILGIIDQISKPKEKSVEIRAAVAKVEVTYKILHFFSSLIYPETSTAQKKLYKELKETPEKKRQEELSKSEKILDTLNLKERLQFYQDVLQTGLPKTNVLWEMKQIKWRPVREK